MKLLSFIFLFLFAATAKTSPVLDINTLEDKGNIKLVDFYAVDLQHADKSIQELLETPEAFTENIKKKHIPNFSGPMWLKLTLTNSYDTGKRVLWVGNYPKVRQIDWYAVKDGKIIQSYQVGEKFPFYERPIPVHLFTLPLEIGSGESLELYIKPHVLGFNITHNSTLESQQYFFYERANYELLHFFYFGILFVMAIYSLLIFLMLKERSYLYYCGFVLSSLVFYLCNSGYAFQYFWPNQPFLNQRIIYISMTLLFCFAAWFTIAFLALPKRLPKISLALRLITTACLVFLVYFLPQPFDPCYKNVRLLSVFSIPIYSLCFVAGIWSYLKFKDINARNYTAAWSLLMLFSIIVLVNEAITKFASFDMLLLLQVVHGIEIILLSIALATAISNLKNKEHFAKAKAETHARFLAKMSHEIRTPMNGILGMADVLKNQLDDDQNKHYASVIHRNATSLGKIINDILDFSSIEAGKLKIKQERFDLSTLTQNAVALFELEAESKALHLQLVLDRELPQTVIGDYQRIHQILINLLSNAVKYTSRGLVCLELTYQKPFIRFHIKDTGMGIAPEDTPKLFLPFEQVGNNKLSSEYSTGLGLTICQDLTRAMNGKLDVISELGKGSVFTLSLPLPTAEPIQNPIIEPDSDNGLEGLSILVFEDNLTNNLVISSMLSQLSTNFHVAENGLEGLAYYKKQPNQIDLILMDCEMPVMDGYDATEAIRAHEKALSLSKTPIIALTANIWPDQKAKCLKSGMDDLLFKPITLDKLQTVMVKNKTSVIKQTNTRVLDLETA